MLLLFDMGVPMIMPTISFMVLALVPLVLVESLYISRVLRIRFSNTVGSVMIANLISTLAGVPFTWLLLFLLQVFTGGLSRYNATGSVGTIMSVTLQAPWLLPLGREEFWKFHLAGLFLLIPFFFATWVIEYAAVRNRLATGTVEAGHIADLRSAERMVWKAFRNANLLTYGLIASLLILSLVINFNLR
ncbi:MAG TPA: hypothetical protein VMZ26_02850 [Pyrinomonadaceae bacterium]|nr:hypothetical protein [Pyrinomonadaceae bacterium]